MIGWRVSRASLYFRRIADTEVSHMRPTATAVLIAACGFVVAAWLLRYEIAAGGHPDSVFVFRLDRWTGHIVSCKPGYWRECVEEERAGK